MPCPPRRQNIKSLQQSNHQFQPPTKLRPADLGSQLALAEPTDFAAGYEARSAE
jgi:hypothetical protein